MYCAVSGGELHDNYDKTIEISAVAPRGGPACNYAKLNSLGVRNASRCIHLTYVSSYSEAGRSGRTAERSNIARRKRLSPTAPPVLLTRLTHPPFTSPHTAQERQTEAPRGKPYTKAQTSKTTVGPPWWMAQDKGRAAARGQRRLGRADQREAKEEGPRSCTRNTPPETGRCVVRKLGRWNAGYFSFSFQSVFWEIVEWNAAEFDVSCLVFSTKYSFWGKTGGWNGAQFECFMWYFDPF